MESAAARICREGGARVTSNVMIRDMDLAAPNPADVRRLEIVADGLPLFGGAQLAIDTTLVSTLHCDGSARPGTVDNDGAVLVAARRRKERTYPKGQTRCACWGSRRTLVPRERAPHPASTGAAGMVFKVASNLVLHSGEGVRQVVVGVARGSGR